MWLVWWCVGGVVDTGVQGLHRLINLPAKLHPAQATPAKLVSFADHMNDVEHALQECTGDEHPLPLCLTMRACRQPLHAKAYLSIPETGGLDGLQQSMADVWLGGDALAVVDDTQGCVAAGVVSCVLTGWLTLVIGAAARCTHACDISAAWHAFAKGGAGCLAGGGVQGPASWRCC